MKGHARRRKKYNDAIAKEKSRQHGVATKRGIKRARKNQHAVLKAVSRSRGKSKAEVAAELFSGRANPGLPKEAQRGAESFSPPASAQEASAEEK